MYPIVGLTRFVRECGVSRTYARALYQRARPHLNEDDKFPWAALPTIFRRNKRLAGEFTHAAETPFYTGEAERLLREAKLCKRQVIAAAIRECKVATIN